MEFEEFEKFWIKLNPTEGVDSAEMISAYLLLDYYGDLVYVYSRL